MLEYAPGSLEAISLTRGSDIRVPSLDGVISAQARLLRWLRDEALPLWDRQGVDRACGGYFETLELGAQQGTIHASGDLRRGRVVARQIYAFDAGQRLGWCSTLSNPVQHGCDYLFSRLHRGEGLFHTSLDIGTHSPRSPFSLYEHAFYLFALARLGALRSGRYPIADTAQRALHQLRRHWGKSNAGFDESDPPSLPLKSNPHMHLLEAALAWIEVTRGAMRSPWIALAQELATLCLDKFVDPQSGVIREYFDHEWRPMSGDLGRIVEPGHQFEWAWLLMQWASSPHCDGAKRAACWDAARRLVEIGERHGVDSIRGVVVNELWDDMTVKDSAAKLWPQTERVKAWCAMLDAADDAADAETASRKIVMAVDRLVKYFRTDAAGLWHEVWSSDGSFVAGASKASSFYHVVCAIEVLGRTVHGGLAEECKIYGRH